jgi:Ribbon-helix-helix protein, copG family
MKPMKCGRPPLNAQDPSAKVTISLPSKELDAYTQRALSEGRSVPDVIRRALRRRRRIKP